MITKERGGGRRSEINQELEKNLPCSPHPLDVEKILRSICIRVLPYSPFLFSGPPIMAGPCRNWGRILGSDNTCHLTHRDREMAVCFCSLLVPPPALQSIQFRLPSRSPTRAWECRAHKHKPLTCHKHAYQAQALRAISVVTSISRACSL